ncbi:MAG: carboxypeptidase-like regulatory domain-containing protein [Vicinamibacterales bacterium]
MSLRVWRRALVLSVLLLCQAAARPGADDGQAAARPGADDGQGSGAGQRGAPPRARAGTGSLSGQIVDGVSGRPVAGVTVGVGAILDGPRAAGLPVSDQSGHFEISALAAGQHMVWARAEGYAIGTYGQVRPGDVPGRVALRDGARVADLRIRMWKLGAITGRVIDEAGAPVAGATIEIRTRAGRGLGGRFGLPVRATTDRNGRYVVREVRPADYLVGVLFTSTSLPAAVLDTYRGAVSEGLADGASVVAALRASRLWIPGESATTRIGSDVFAVVAPEGPAPRPSGQAADDRPRVYRTTFHPGVSTVAEARPVRVLPGETRFDVDFQLATLPTVRVSGVVSGSDGPAPYTALRLLTPEEPPAEANEFISLASFETAVTVADARGAFTFHGVPAGRYVLTTAPPGRTPWARTEIVVGESDVQDVTVQLRQGIRVHGRVEFAGTSRQRPTTALFPGASIARLGQLVPTGYATPDGVAPEADGAFTTPPYPPGRYLVLDQRLGPWMLRSAMLDGRDVSVLPMELSDDDVTGLVLTYTDQPTYLRGTIAPRPDGGLRSELDVMVFPADVAAWVREGLPSHLPSRQMRTLHPDEDGTFQVVGLAPGNYLVAAFPAGEGGDPDADFLDLVARVATPISLAEGAPRVVELMPVSLRRDAIRR